jgi:hypothetical protein
MLLGTSSLALYIPWGGGAGPYLGICLWLWLGVLDSIQGVGLGMILLQVNGFFNLYNLHSLTRHSRRFQDFTSVLHWLSPRLLDLFVS